jgi:phosphate:Na+ symporter
MESSPSILLLIFKLLGSLALLIFGMKQMSDTLQKMAGPQLRHILGRMTTNRFTGMFTGMFVTAAVQSSTATTVMTVSFVNASLLTLAQAISVIMGANIGTTLTAWIMSAGFAFNITDLVWPAFVIALFLIYRKRNKTIGDFIFGLAFMFLGLGTLRMTGMDMKLGEQQVILDFFQSFDKDSFWTTLIFLVIGGILTMCCQSSAAVMAITMILCSSGALPIYQGIALVMGENIGTTVTSNLAALSASTQARRAAFAHMFFNLFGVFWILIIFKPFVNFVCSLVGYDVEMPKESSSFASNTAKLSVVLATFHTCFNVINTFILIWFIPQIEKLVCKVIKGKKKTDDEADDNEPVRLKYIEGGLMSTPEISVYQAQQEITVFGKRMHRMFGFVQGLLNDTDEEMFEKTYNRVVKYEDISDNMEIEIAKYLEKVSEAQLSEETTSKIHDLMREISELESIGDSCYNIARIFKRVRDNNEKFIDTQKANIDKIMNLTLSSLEQMMVVLNGRREDLSMKETYRIENEINTLRDEYKMENMSEIKNHKYDYFIGTAYIDLVNECERLGDYVVNVVEAKFSKF